MAPTTDAPVAGRDAVLFDLDGVVYKGSLAIPHAVDSINSLAVRVGYLTNNASRRAETVAEQLRGFGLHAEADDVVTSPQAAMRLLIDRVAPGSPVLVVGGDGLTSEVEKAGFRLVASADDGPAAVVQGFAPHVAWTDLAEACFALQGGGENVHWIATNTDWTIPVERGTAPGNGTLVSAVHTAVGRLPVVAGKPEVAIFEASVDRFGAAAPLFVGDRLDTDILGANRAGIPSALVLTGIDGPKQVLAADKDSRPDFILRDLREIESPYPLIDVTPEDDGAIVTVRGAVVSRRKNVLKVERSGDDPVDLLRAGAAAIWQSGLQIFGLVVPEELYDWA